jgi:DNA processing protein
MSHACESCLARGRLIGMLAPRFERIADRNIRSISTLLARPEDELLAAAGHKPHEFDELKRAARMAARTDTEADRMRDGGAVCIHGDLYPPRLRELADPPRALYFTGPLDRMLGLTSGAQRPVAVVGSRAASPPARHAARELGRGLAAAGIPVVSGLAFGIDAAAHHGAVDAGGPLIAVLGSGADAAHPKTNRPLYTRVRAIGTVVSELPWGQVPFRWTFPARNRIMAALAEMTVVVEAAVQSGSLITVDFAHALGREVGAVPSMPGVSTSEGSNELLHGGAAFIRGPADVLDLMFGVDVRTRLMRPQGGDAADPRIAAILDVLTAGGPLDEARERSGRTARELRTALARLERQGMIRKAGFAGYVPTAGPAPDVPKLEPGRDAGPTT